MCVVDLEERVISWMFGWCIWNELLNFPGGGRRPRSARSYRPAETAWWSASSERRASRRSLASPRAARCWPR
jgi:hypothetical protein